MTGYKLVRTSETNFDLKDPDGNTVTSLSPPVRTPDDLMDPILDDLGVTNTAIRSAVKVATTGSIPVEDRTGN